MSGCTKLNYRVMLIKVSRLFMYILNNLDILFRFGRFLCVNAYFGASIHLTSFFVSNHGKQETWYTKPKKVWKFLYAQLKFDGLK